VGFWGFTTIYFFITDGLGWYWGNPKEKKAAGNLRPEKKDDRDGPGGGRPGRKKQNKTLKNQVREF